MATVKQVKKPATKKRTPSKKRAGGQAPPRDKAPAKKKTKPKSKFREKRIILTGKRKKIERVPTPKGGGARRIKTSVVKAALIEARGNVSRAAKNLGVARGNLYRTYIDKHEELQECLNDIREGWTDQTEDKLVEAVENGEAWAVCFYLKCQGKKRGYIEKLLLGGQFGQDIKINITGNAKGGVADGIN